MKKFRFYLAFFVGKTIIFLMKLFRLKGGSDISGKIALKIDGDLVRNIKGIDYGKCVFITGTNGKSTTTNLVYKTLESSGYKVACNVEGANLLSGAATVLLKNTTMGARFNKDFLVLETDERYLSKIYSYIPTKYLCITNIQKDQVQRNGTPEFIFNKIKEVVKKVDTVFLNGEEPNSLALKKYANHYYIYSVERHSKTLDINKENTYSTACYYCQSPTDFQYYNLDKIGQFKCTNCDFTSEEGDFTVKDVDFEGRTFVLNGEEFYMPYTDSFFLYGYGAAIGILMTMGVDVNKIKESLKTFKNIEGRVEEINYHSKEQNKSINLKFYRIKQENPETLQSAIDTVALSSEKKILLLCLDKIEDFTPNYVNTLYPYEVDFSRLSKDGNTTFFCFGTEVVHDLALRLSFDGIGEDMIHVVESNDSKELMEEICKVAGENEEIYMIATLMRYDNIKNSLNKSVEIKG